MISPDLVLARVRRKKVKLAIGLMSGLGLAYFRETWNQKFHTEAEVEHFLGIPVIAVIPNLKEDKAA
jgi:capsular polysaccharide biosynthesis protein